MCTAFVKYGKDYICGFNMDINIEAMNWDIEMDENLFAIVNHTPLGPLKIQGVNRNGVFASQLNNMRFSKAPFEIGENCIPLYEIIDGCIQDKYTLEDAEKLARTKRVVNLPTGSIGIPDMAMHSLLSDAKENIMVLEPGNGISILSEKYAAMTNFALLELPEDFTAENFGYYGKDRYDTAMSILRNSSDDFGVKDGLHLLEEVKQTGKWATRISFVYSYNERAVYYCRENDFENIQVHRF